MRKYLICGRYTICIDGRSSLLNKLSMNWGLSSEEKRPDVVLHIEEMLQDYASELREGWNQQVTKDSCIAVYYRNGKPLFGLKQLTPNSVRIDIRSTIDNYLSIGIQYAMMVALHRECFGLHGVTILCGNEIIVLSAPSGTGKTTLAKLLEKYCEAIVINGDFALLHPTEDGVFFEPTPFCGTSGRCLNHRFLVDRVVFLCQAIENKWRILDGRDAVKYFLSNCFIPTWDQRMRETVVSNILSGIDGLRVNAYGFAPTKNAAEFFRSRLMS